MAAGGEPAPGGAPTLSPQQPLGDETQADAQVQVAVSILQRAYIKYPFKSSKAGTLMRVLGLVSKEWGREEDASQKILPAELKNAMLADQTPPGPGAPPAGGGGPGGGGPGAAPGALPQGGGPPGAMPPPGAV